MATPPTICPRGRSRCHVFRELENSQDPETKGYIDDTVDRARQHIREVLLDEGRPRGALGAVLAHTDVAGPPKRRGSLLGGSRPANVSFRQFRPSRQIDPAPLLGSTQAPAVQQTSVRLSAIS
jgi:hypothetical protein